MWISHFLSNRPDKPIFHKSLDVLFFAYLYTHTRNTLLVDNTPYKNMFNGPYNAIFLDSFDGYCGEDHYLLGFVFPYLENLHSFGYGVPTFVEHIPLVGLNVLIEIIQNFLKCYFGNVVRPSNPIFVTMWNWNWKKKYLINCSSSIFSCLNI